MPHPTTSQTFRAAHISRVVLRAKRPAPTRDVFLARDISRRTVAVAADASGGPLTYLTTQDGGHSFDRFAITGTDGATFPALALSPATGRLGLFFSLGDSVYQANSARDGETGGDWGTPAALVTGDYCTVAAKGKEWALFYVDAGALKVMTSGDAGQTWDAAETIDTGLDLSVGGRPAAAWTGQTLCVAVPGATLTTYTNAGGSWSAAATVSSDAIQALTMTALPGVLLLAGREGDGTMGDPYAPVLRRSTDGAATWATEAVPPPTDDQYALGRVPDRSGLLWGITHKSEDDAQAWAAV